MYNIRHNVNLKDSRYLLFVDTETIGTLTNEESVLPFDIGIKIYDQEKEKVVIEKSYIIRKFFNNRFIMRSTFSASKYPNYASKLENDKRYKLYSVNEVAKDIIRLRKKYNLDIFVAHNADFDFNALRRLFAEFGIENPFETMMWLDLMELSKVITMWTRYEEFCIMFKDLKDSQKQSRFITNGGRVRTTAEAIYCFLTQNPDFREEHIGLDDLDAELLIFKKCIDARKYFEFVSPYIVEVNTPKPRWKDWQVITKKEK